MADLVFKYGSMGSSKTASCLMLRFECMENGLNVLFLKPSIDNRDGVSTVKSRIGIEADAFTYDADDSISRKFANELIDCDVIIIDEVQFSSKKQIEELKAISEGLDKPVYTFGLRTDFKTNLWEGSKRLFELATVIEELPKKCFCGNSAIVNARYDEKGIVSDGKQVELGSNDKYKALCYTCYKRGRVNGKR